MVTLRLKSKGGCRQEHAPVQAVSNYEGLKRRKFATSEIACLVLEVGIIILTALSVYMKQPLFVRHEPHIGRNIHHPDGSAL
jgi:hypothetical protein